MDLKEVMAINLRRVRHAKKMTQEELAESAGLSVRPSRRKSNCD